MNNIIYQWLSTYIKDDKKLVQYLYVLYLLFSKHQDTVYSYITQVKNVNDKIWDMLDFFEEKKFKKKDIYNLLEYSINKTWYNVFELHKSSSFNTDLDQEETICKNIDSDVWVYVKTADNKIYKRFLLDDVQKMLWI